MFKGHQFVKLVNDSWILDLTEFKGYEVNLDSNGEVISFRQRFSITVDNGKIELQREMGAIPVKILKEAINQVKNHLEMMGLDRAE